MLGTWPNWWEAELNRVLKTKTSNICSLSLYLNLKTDEYCYTVILIFIFISILFAFQVVCFSSVYFIYSYVPETHLKEMPQLLRDLNQRFQNLPLSFCCSCSRRGTGSGCCSCTWHWNWNWNSRNSHNRVPLAVHLNYTGSSASLSSDGAMHDKLEEHPDPGLHSVSTDSEDFPKPHEFTEIHL